MRRLLALLALVLGSLAAAGAGTPAAAVEVVPIHGTIDAGMAHLVARAVADARRRGASILLDVDTFGGLVASGTEIRDLLGGAGVPVDAYVRRAWSAGALVTLAADRIVYAPGASIGAAEPIPSTAKNISALRGEFAATATRHARDPRVAAAMVDPSFDLPGVKPAGQILTLTGDEAVRARYGEAVVADRDAALARFGLARAAPVEPAYTWAEQLARAATAPEISGLLLALGFVGLLVEMQTLHGIAGTLGALALGLFFGTHVYAGFSNGLVAALAVLGLLGIMLEFHVLPGHGVAGGLGTVALVAAILLAFGLPFLVAGVQALATAIVLSAIAFAIVARIHPENAFVARLVFRGAQDASYAAAPDLRALLGRRGVAASFLRPAGLATLGDERVDVLTDGEFVPAGTPIVVTRVEGARVFVRPADAA